MDPTRTITYSHYPPEELHRTLTLLAAIDLRDSSFNTIYQSALDRLMLIQETFQNEYNDDLSKRLFDWNDEVLSLSEEESTLKIVQILVDKLAKEILCDPLDRQYMLSLPMLEGDPADDNDWVWEKSKLDECKILFDGESELSFEPFKEVPHEFAKAMILWVNALISQTSLEPIASNRTVTPLCAHDSSIRKEEYYELFRKARMQRQQCQRQKSEDVTLSEAQIEEIKRYQDRQVEEVRSLLISKKLQIKAFIQEMQNEHQTKVDRLKAKRKELEDKVATLDGEVITAQSDAKIVAGHIRNLRISLQKIINEMGDNRPQRSHWYRF